jgi:hypothetical protein
MRQFAATILRLVVLGIVWISALILLHFGAVGVGAMSGAHANGMLYGFMIVSLFVFAVLTSERVLRVNVNFEERKPAPRKTAVEPETLRLRDMMALLDEDDLDDLRAEVRESLRGRIRRLSADETETFEELLSNTGTKRKREVR